VEEGGSEKKSQKGRPIDRQRNAAGEEVQEGGQENRKRRPSRGRQEKKKAKKSKLYPAADAETSLATGLRNGRRGPQNPPFEPGGFCFVDGVPNARLACRR